MVEDEVDKWKRELKAAGWTYHGAYTWKSPSGHYYRGPYFAWTIMKSMQQHNSSK